MGEDRKSDDLNAQERLALAIHDYVVNNAVQIYGILHRIPHGGQVWIDMVGECPTNPTPGDIVEFVFDGRKTPAIGYCFVIYGREGRYTSAYVDRTKMGRRMTFEEFEPALMYARIQIMEGWEK